MKHRNLLVAAGLLLIVTLFSISCKKGGQGPAGTANVIYSDWLDVSFTVIKNTAGDTLGYQAIINAPKLTTDIINNGDVKVFVNINTAASPTIVPLPNYDPFVIADVINCYFTAQKITLISAGDESTFTSSGNKYFQYRYVLIPGGVKADASVNWNNYQEVKQATGMKD